MASAPESIRRAIAAWIGALAPHHIYVVLASVFGLVFVFLTPPAGAGDEPRHFERMVEVATGRWLGGEGAPAGIIAFTDLAKDTVEAGEGFSPEILAQLKAIPLRADDIQPYPRPLEIILRVHHPFAYVPYAPAVWAGVLFDLRPATIFFLCKLTTLFIGVMLMTLAIRLMPAHNHLAALIALLPTTVFYLGAANIDALLAGSAFLFFALVMRAVDRRALPITLRETGIIALVGFAVCILKTPYALLPLLAVLIPASRFSSARARVCALAAITLPGLIAAGVWAVLAKIYMLDIGAYSTPGGTYVQPAEQMALLMANPTSLFAMLLRTLIETPFAALSIMEMIGLLGWNNVLLPGWVYAGLLAALLALWLGAPAPSARAVEGRGRAGAWRRMGPAAVQAGLFTAIVAGACTLLYLQWTGVGARTVEGFQGRYLIPLAPLLFALAPARLAIRMSSHVQTLILAGAATIGLVMAVVAVWRVFY